MTYLVLICVIIVTIYLLTSWKKKPDNKVSQSTLNELRDK